MGRDVVSARIALQCFYFNSHARVGRDLNKLLIVDSCKISTHTPAWGATCKCIIVHSNISYFNSHARVGRDAERSDLSA